MSHVIIDEANERKIHTDFLLAVLKLILPSRHDLKLIVLTTSDHADHLANYFFNMRYVDMVVLASFNPHGCTRFQQPAMCVEVPVEALAVNMYYLNDIEQLLHWRCVCVRLCTCLCMCVHVCMYLCTYHALCGCVHACMYMCMCMCLCPCVCITLLFPSIYA